jgi:hypothetical protein
MGVVMARTCKDCGANLSSYNQGLLCWPCQKKKKELLQEQIGDTPNYTVDNLRIILGLKNPESVKRLGRKGKIPGRIPGVRQHLYRRDKVDLWIKEGQQQLPNAAMIEESAGVETPHKQKIESLSKFIELPDNCQIASMQENSRSPSAPNNNVSEALQIKNPPDEQNEKPSLDTNTQTGPTIAEENKHEPLPKDAEPLPTTMQSSYSEPLSKASKESMPLSPEEKSLICLAPPDGINVVVLESWGIPDKKAADILYRWCKLHRENSHQMCIAFRTLEDNLKNQKIPFRQAELYLNAELYVREFSNKKDISFFERSLKYRTWERPENLKAFFKEYEDLMKPVLLARQKHLNDVENLLRGLQEAVLGALETKKYDGLLKMEENPLFENLQRHSYGVYAFFWDLKRNLETAQYLESDKTTSEIDKTMDNSKRKELLKLQKDTITSIKQLRKAIDYTLKNKLYSKEWCPDCYQDATIETNP